MLAGLTALLGGGGGGGGSFESIQTITATGGETSLTFSSIPSTYKHLQIRAIVRDVAYSEYLWWPARINGTTSGYASHYLQGDGSTTEASGQASQSEMKRVTLAGYSTSTFAATIIDLHDYSSTTKNKTVKIFTGVDQNGSGIVSLASNLLTSTSAVSSISFTFSNLAAGSKFALYGIKG
jgi:hypothetical protein